MKKVLIYFPTLFLCPSTFSPVTWFSLIRVIRSEASKLQNSSCLYLLNFEKPLFDIKNVLRSMNDDNSISWRQYIMNLYFISHNGISVSGSHVVPTYCEVFLTYIVIFSIRFVDPSQYHCKLPKFRSGICRFLIDS